MQKHVNLGRTLVLLIATLGVVGGTFLEIAGSEVWGLDDAYISYRYASNLVSGLGLVFNPGEYVEGYSNPAYVLAVAAGLSVFGPDHVFALSMGINLVAIVCAVFILYAVANTEVDQNAGLAVAVLFGWHPAVWSATASGLETAVVILLHLSLWLSVIRWKSTRKICPLAMFYVIILLEVWMRVDGFVFPLIALIYLFLHKHFRAAGAGLVCLGTSIATTIVWRMSYYGEPIPNTVHAKVTGAMGDRVGFAFRRLMEAVTGEGLLVPVFVSVVAIGLAVLCAIVRIQGLRLFFRMPFGIAVTCLLYWFWIGGDHLGLRFLLPVIPAGLVLMFSALRYHGIRRRWQYCVTAIVLIAQFVPLLQDFRNRYPFEKRDGWMALGEHLGAQHPGKVLAIDAVGKVPYISGLETVDMLGLTDAHIARTDPKATRFFPGHMKWDGKYVLSRKPDLIAAFIFPNGDMPQVGLTAIDYLQQGYAPKYLVSPSGNSPPFIVDLETTPDLTQDVVLQLIENGYDYLVVVKR